jgi:hypothetical protein
MDSASGQDVHNDLDNPINIAIGHRGEYRDAERPLVVAFGGGKRPFGVTETGAVIGLERDRVVVNLCADAKFAQRGDGLLS